VDLSSYILVGVIVAIVRNITASSSLKEAEDRIKMATGRTPII